MPYINNFFLSKRKGGRGGSLVCVCVKYFPLKKSNLKISPRVVILFFLLTKGMKLKTSKESYLHLKIK